VSAAAYGLTVACAIGTALVAGVFFTFSTFAIEGLRRLAPADGAAAMQAINREAPRAPFLALFLGTGAACLALLGHAVLHLDVPGAGLRVTACVLYLLGGVVLTGAYHVPRNERLDALDPAGTEGVAYWAVYLREWVRMNHVRTVAPAVAALLLILSLRPA
jgi:uncharacterized membrane protein